MEKSGKVVPYVGLSKKSKVTFAWIIFVLIINTLNVIAYNTFYILILVEELNQDDTLYEFFLTFCLYWLDVLTLTNGICFLMIFK